MEKYIRYMAIMAVFLFGFSACEFSPSEIPVTEIEKPSEIAPEISLDLIPEMDTLRISTQVWITYSVQTGNRQLKGIYILFDENEVVNRIYESESKVRAYIPADQVQDGMHQLRIVTITDTGSGSIAEKTDNEGYLYEIKWPVYVNKKARDYFKFNAPLSTPKGLKISWTQYRYADFSQYDFGWYSEHFKSGKLSISYPRQNFYIDSTYVEGCYYSYSVTLYYSDGFNYDNLIYNKPIINPAIHINKDCSVDVTWTHSKNESEVNLYCIKTSAPNYGVPEEHDVSVLNDTTLRLNGIIGFGGDYQVQLRYIPKGFTNYHTVLNITGGLTSFALGDSMPVFQKGFYIPVENSLLTYNSGIFSKYDLLTNTVSDHLAVTPVEDSKIWAIISSPDRNYFGYFDNQEFVVRRSIDFSVVKKLNVEAFSGYNFLLNDISISNSGLISTADYNNNLRVFDLVSGVKIFDKHFDADYLKKSMISPDGKNLAVMIRDYNLNDNVLVYYSFDNNQLIELSRVNGVGEDYTAFLAYAPEADQKIIVSRWRSVYNYNIEVRDTRTFALINTIQVPFLFVPVAYDFAADRAIAQYQSFPTQKFSYLIDVKSASMKKTIAFSGNKPLIFEAGNVFSGNGRWIKIDDFIIQ